jgi:hypothetical protein
MKSLCVVHYWTQDYKVEQSVNNFQALAQQKHEWKESNTTSVFTDGHDAIAKKIVCTYCTRNYRCNRASVIQLDPEAMHKFAEALIGKSDGTVPNSIVCHPGDTPMFFCSSR